MTLLPTTVANVSPEDFLPLVNIKILVREAALGPVT
jgi:hypothetical protein